MILDQIQILVCERAGEQNSAVIDAFLIKLKKEHIKTAHLKQCDCHYCQNLQFYTKAKLRAHRIKRRFYYEDFESDPLLAECFSDALRSARDLRQLKNAAKEL